MLGDGKWNKIDQLKQLVGLSDHEVQEIARFLSQYDFVEIDEGKRRVRINRDFRKILVSACYRDNSFPSVNLT